MNETTHPAVLQALVDMTAMVLAATPPEDALQSLADALDVRTAGIGRLNHATGEATVLAQNTQTSVVSRVWFTRVDTPENHGIVLREDEDACDILIIQDRIRELRATQIKTLEHCEAYLKTLWAARTDAFDRALSLGRRPATKSVLHPDNPYNLTPTELRVCTLIDAGHRPTTMAQTMKTSMPTVRTHLRSINAKTGLDGMIGVMRHLQTHADQPKATG